MRPSITGSLPRDADRCHSSEMPPRDGTASMQAVARGPDGLVVKRGVWYRVAGTTEGLRTYRISRIEDAAVLAEVRAAGHGPDAL